MHSVKHLSRLAASTVLIFFYSFASLALVSQLAPNLNEARERTKRQKAFENQ
jgi:hypothetical protein